MADFNWYDRKTSAITDVVGGAVFEVKQKKPTISEISVFVDSESRGEYDVKTLKLTIQKDLGTTKKLVENAITYLNKNSISLYMNIIKEALNKAEQTQAHRRSR